MEELAIFGGKPVRENKIFYGRQYIDQADVDAVAAVMTSDYITCGPKVKELEEAANVMELTITSSPSPKPAARAARCRAAVPLHTTTAYLACVNSHKCSSSSFTLGPQVM